jgi:peptidyl-dipeptidase Dcp
MQFKTIFYLILLSTLGLNSHFAFMNKEVVVTSNEVTGKLKTQSNPLLQPWTGDFGGYPAFDKVKLGDFLPAIEIAITEAKKEIDKIATNKEHPTFDNTLLALEKSGQMLNRVVAIYWIWSSTMSTPEFQKIEQIVEPKLTAFDDWVTQNPQLFQRIKAIYTGPGYKQLSHEAQRLVKIKYDNLVRNGANLNDAQKAELSKYNQELSSLYTQFSQNLLADESEKTVVVMSLNELDGLSQSLVDAASQAAEDVGMEGKFVIKNTRSSVDPVLTYANNRDLRERVWRMFTGRGDNGDKNDNNEVIVKILSLRSKKAKLLGFKTHAHWRLENSMAKVPENAMKLMLDVWEPAKKKVQEEVADMQAYADMAGDKITIEPWDYKFYAEKVRKEKYDLDQNEVKEYLQLDKLKEGMFWVAGQIFNLSFDKLQGIPTCHADVEVWEVKNRITGKHVGLWYFDPYARNGKRSGAWMNAYREQQRVTGDIPTIVSNNSNFVKGREGEAVLISWDDASTLFHEFGHALHGLLSNVTYPSLSGTNVYTDYVEFPSQLLEFWLATPEVLQNFALHYRSGKPIPQDLVNKIQKASTFNEGFATTEYLASALIDMELHLAEIPTTDPDQFEKVELSKLGMPKEIVMRHRTPQFGHIFSSDQYSAGYYSYLWADVLTADGYQAFLEGKGPYDTDIAKRLIANVFSVGNTIDPEEGYRKFRGRDPQVAALMRKRGLQ